MGFLQSPLHALPAVTLRPAKTFCTNALEFNANTHLSQAPVLAGNPKPPRWKAARSLIQAKRVYNRIRQRLLKLSGDTSVNTKQYIVDLANQNAIVNELTVELLAKELLTSDPLPRPLWWCHKHVHPNRKSTRMPRKQICPPPGPQVMIAR